MDLEALKINLKLIAERNLEFFFEDIEEIIIPTSHFFNEVLHLKGRYFYLTKTEFDLIEFNRVRLNVFQLIDEIDECSLAPHSNKKFSRTFRPLSFIPPTPNYILYRESLLNKLNEQIQNNKIVGITGIGGVGKSTLALEFINDERYINKFSNVAWITVNLSLKESLLSGLSNSQTKFKYSKELSVEHNLHNLIYILNEFGARNLLIIDNLNEYSDYLYLINEFNSLNWKIIYTTRIVPSNISSALEIPPFDKKNSIKLFENYCSRESIDANYLNRILDIIDNNTLIIELIGKMLATNSRINLKEIYERLNDLSIFEESGSITIDTGRHGYDVKYRPNEANFNNYILSLYDLSKIEGLKEKYLIYFCYLPPKFFESAEIEELFAVSNDKKVIVSKLDALRVENLLFNADVEIEVSDFNSHYNTLNELIREGWLQNHQGLIKVHSLIHTTVRFKFKELNSSFFDPLLIGLVGKIQYKHETNILEQLNLIDIGDFLFRDIRKSDSLHIYFLIQFAILLNNLFDSNKSINILSKCEKELLGNDFGKLGRLLYNTKGMVLYALGDYKEARDYLEKTLEFYKNDSLEVDKENLGTLYNNLGSTYMSLKDFVKADKYLHKSYIIRKEIYPEKHPAMAEVINNAGNLFFSTGNISKAIEYFFWSLEILIHNYTKNHPNVILGLINIANVIFHHTFDKNQAFIVLNNAYEIASKLEEPLNEHLTLSCDKLWNRFKDYYIRVHGNKIGKSIFNEDKHDLPYIKDF